MNLLLIRHTKPLIKSGICYGQTDLHLEYKDFLIKRNYIIKKIHSLQIQWDSIFSSPLIRCAYLAEYINKKLKLKLFYDDLLKEFHYGKWENVPYEDIKVEMEEWSKDYINIPTPDGESLKMFIDRTNQIYNELIHLNHNIIVVTHIGVIRSFYLFYNNLSLNSFFDFSLDYGDLLLLKIN